MRNRIERVLSYEESRYLTDLQILARAHELIDNPSLGHFFVVTGSHAVQLLTGERLDHNDLDANVFVGSGEALEQVAALMASVDGFILWKRTDDRLEYDVSGVGSGCPRRVELQFVGVDNFVVRDGLGSCRFVVGTNSKGKEAIIPTTIVSVNDFTFRVKTLPYLIATWVIRVSGLALNPKRAVRASDIEHLGLLLRQDYSYDEVMLAMEHHPQMPKDHSEKEIFQKALRIVDSKPY